MPLNINISELFNINLESLFTLISIIVTLSIILIQNEYVDSLDWANDEGDIYIY